MRGIAAKKHLFDKQELTYSRQGKSHNAFTLEITFTNIQRTKVIKLLSLLNNERFKKNNVGTTGI